MAAFHLRSAGFLLGLGAAFAAAALEYPQSKRGDVVDDYHGTKVADPYRWLEDVDARDTRSWVKAQNALSLPFLAGLPEREVIKARLSELWNYERRSVPRKAGGRYFYTRNDGLQNQAALYVQDGLKEPPRLLLDPNALSEAGTLALSDFEPAPDGARIAVALAAAGSDWNQVKVLDAADGKAEGDVLERVKFSVLSWTRDSQGFFYSRYPEAKGGNDVFEELSGQALYYHRLGTKQSEDRLIASDPAHGNWIYEGRVTDDGSFLLLRIFEGAGNQSRLSYLYLGRNPKQPALDGKLTPLVEDFKSIYQPIGNIGAVLYLLTDFKAPKKRIVAVDLRAPEQKNWQTVVAEGADAIDTAVHAGRQLVVSTLHDASTRLLRYDVDGQALAPLKLPGLGAVPDDQFSGRPQDNEFFFGFRAFNRPLTTQRCDLKSGACSAFQPPELRFKPEDYVTTQVFFRSKDGTRVPMFLTGRKGLKKNPHTPTLLYGYGGFEVSLTPAFSVPDLVWMEQGGLYAQVNLRGGGEYGQAWHEAGTRARKQNVFNDFIAAAEYLIKSGYTSTPNLAIRGRSNGGLLIGAVLNQRPDLFGAALPIVGVMDMLRFHTFTIGAAWTQDYGSSADPAGFKYLYAYSPYHNVRPGTKYPPTLITTADHDDRVVPGHSFKYAAALQAAQAASGPDAAPVLIRIDVDAGHGSGKPVSKLIEEWADMLAFVTHYTRPAPVPTPDPR